MSKKELVVLIILLLAIATRFLFISFGQSAIPGFAAVGAMMMLAGAHLGSWKKWIFPLAIFWVSDLIINNVVFAQYFDSFQVFGSIWVFMAYTLIVLIAFLLMKKPSIVRLLVTSTTAAVIFFLVTNFGSWLNPVNQYPQNLSGLISSYEAGLPFFRNGLMGDLFFGLVLFGLYEVIAARVESIEPLLFRKSVA